MKNYMIEKLPITQGPNPLLTELEQFNQFIGNLYHGDTEYLLRMAQKINELVEAVNKLQNPTSE